MTVATGRWPAVRFEVRNTVVQGPNAVPQIVEALRELDRDAAVDVIVIARGGGSVEDLLPFSDETLCRAIAACTTPVVSAVGHEPDNPLCDLVADLARGHPDRRRQARRTRRRRRAGARLGPPQTQRTGAAQLGAPRAAHHLAAAQQAGAGPAAGRAHRACRGDPPGPRGRAPRHQSARRPPNPSGSVTCRPGCPHWDRRPPWPAAMRWFRRCLPRTCCARRVTLRRAHGCGYGSPTGPSPLLARASRGTE